MSEDDVYKFDNFGFESEKKKEEKIKIEYANPKFWRRVMAGLIDLLILVVVFIIIFVSARAIVVSTDTYKENNEELTAARVESGLYRDDPDWGMIDIISYLNRMDLSGWNRMSQAQSAVNTFLSFCDERCDEETARTLRDDYDAARLSDNFTDNYGNHYFIVDENGNIAINDVAYANVTAQGYFDNFYTYYIDEVLQGYLVIAVPNYYDLTKYMSNVLIYAEILPAFLISGVLVYYVPTLIFKKGRKTIGKLAYHIGTVDKRLLNPTWKRNLARFLIFYFFIYILSVFTFAIPVIISFSMMAFSRNKQGFPDFCLNLADVSTRENDIFNDYSEVKVGKMDTSKEPVNFSRRDLN
ncbi:MAG: RDD family protein [Coprobacillus sp.]|nr:RDD family protein [Coprobacillus sp.]